MHDHHWADRGLVLGTPVVLSHLVREHSCNLHWEISPAYMLLDTDKFSLM